LFEKYKIIDFDVFIQLHTKEVQYYIIIINLRDEKKWQEGKRQIEERENWIKHIHSSLNVSSWVNILILHV